MVAAVLLHAEHPVFCYSSDCTLLYSTYDRPILAKLGLRHNQRFEINLTLEGYRQRQNKGGGLFLKWDWW